MKPLERRRALLVGLEGERGAARELFARHELVGWQLAEAHDFPHARFVLQAQPCDVVLVQQFPGAERNGRLLNNRSVGEAVGRGELPCLCRSSDCSGRQNR